MYCMIKNTLYVHVGDNTIFDKTTPVLYMSRILVTHVPTLGKYREEVLWHIPHKYTKEMSQKSEIVSKLHAIW